MRFALPVFLAVLAPAALLTACGQATSDLAQDGAQGIQVAIQPPSAQVAPAATARFAAAVTGTVNTGVTWRIEEAGGGQIDGSGLYVAPAAAGTYHVTAASVADPTVSITATVLVTSQTVLGPGARCLPDAGTGAALSVWVPALSGGANPGLADGMARLTPTAAAPSRPYRSACIAAGRGEYEPFQIVLAGGTGGRSGVSLTATALTGPGGATIAATNVRFYREFWQTLPASSTNPGGGNQPLGAGVYPDGLLPFLNGDGSRNGEAVPFSVGAGRVQPIWVDVFVPRGGGSPSGTYTGSVTVASDQGSAVVPVTLTVWNFELPAKPTLKTSFGIYSARYENRACQQLLVEHKVSPKWLQAADATALAPRGLSAAAPRGFGAFGGGSLGTSTFQSAAASFPSDLPLYVYNIDEPGTGWYTSGLQADVCAMRRSSTRFKHLVTTSPDMGPLDDGCGSGHAGVDIWAFLPNHWGPGTAPRSAAFDAARARVGTEFWPYTAVVQDDYSPKWPIDFSPLNFRAMGFIHASLGFEGMLYWMVDYWWNDRTTGEHYSVPINPWTEVADYGYGGGDDNYSDGTLVYPAKLDGSLGADCFAPTMRLKWVRKSVDDYEYAALAKAGGVASWLTLVRAAATSYGTWTKDPAVFADARVALAQAIHAAAR